MEEIGQELWGGICTELDFRWSHHSCRWRKGHVRGKKQGRCLVSLGVREEEEMEDKAEVGWE